MALLVGFALDQQVTVQKAFSGPLVLRERLGSLDADTLAQADLEPIFRERPAIHRFPGAMAQRVHDLAVHVRDTYDGDAARVWTDAADGPTRCAPTWPALPGFGEMKVKALGAVLAKRFGVEAAAGPGAVAPDARRRRLRAGAGRLPGRQARPQGRVVEGQGRLLGAARARPRPCIRSCGRAPAGRWGGWSAPARARDAAARRRTGTRRRRPRGAASARAAPRSAARGADRGSRCRRAPA